MWAVALAAAALTACTHAPPSAGTSTPDTPAVFAPLYRPLSSPSLAPDDSCPVSPTRALNPFTGSASGAGPVYAIIGQRDRSGVVHFATRSEPTGAAKVLWQARPSFQGPLLIRGHRLDSRGTLMFRLGSDAPLTDRLLLDAGTSPDRSGWNGWPSEMFLPGSGCYALQVDATEFSYAIVFQARP